MAARAVAIAGTIALAIALAGCPGDPENVDPQVNAKAFSTAASLVAAVRGGSWGRACSLLTLEAQIEVEAWVQRRERRRLRPSCERALSGAAFGELCGELWKRTRSGTTIYRKDDVSGTGSKPTVAWAVVTRRRQLTGRCELRLTRPDSDEVNWRIDAIAVDRSQAVLRRARDELVFRNKVPVAEQG